MDYQWQKDLYEFKANSNPEELAYLFIQKFGHNPDKIPASAQDLLNKLIDDERLPEECAQQLLCIKVLSLMTKQNGFNEALILLDKLNDPTYRLACFTSTYFQLVLLKADILIFQTEYELALVYVKSIYELYSTDEEFNLLEHVDKIKNALILKMAIAAHFGKLEQDDLSYRLFSMLHQNGSLSQLTVSNINSVMIFAYECLSVQKYQEAAQIFGQILDFVKTNPNDFSCLNSKKELKQESMAMLLISKKLANMTVSKDEIQDFCTLFADMEGMSDKNKHLRERVVELVLTKAKSAPLVTPMYQSKTQGKNVNQGMQLNQDGNQKPSQAKNGSPRYG